VPIPDFRSYRRGTIGLSAAARTALGALTRWVAVLLALAFLFAPARVSAADRISDVRPKEVPAEFSSLDSGFVRIYYPRELGAEARALTQVAVPFRRELSEMLGPHGPFLQHVEVRLGRTPLEMEKLAPAGVRFPTYAGGVALPSARLIFLTARPRFPGEKHNLVEIFKHELAHVGLHDRVGEAHIPRWFDEGFAVFASGEGEVARMQTMWTATLAKKLIPLAKLDRQFPEDANTASVAYAQAADLIRFLQRGDGMQRFRAIFSRIDSQAAFDRALGDAYGVDLFALETEWLEDAARRYTFWPILVSSSTVWLVAMGLFGVAYVSRRKRAQRKLQAWAIEEAREDAERERIAHELAQIRVMLARPEAIEPMPETEGVLLEVSLVRGVPYVEHEGSRHTLH
jgi:hypothetical protein